MIKPDLITVWPINSDYPLWREMVRANRHHFNKVIIGFMQTNDGIDNRRFVMSAMSNDGVDFIDCFPYNSGQDWRDVITNACLRISTSNWVFFTEQDFFMREKFWNTVESVCDTENLDYIGVKQGERLHPCCLFIKKEALEKTSRDFAIGDSYDHFGLIQKEIEANEAMGYIMPDNTYFHLNGLTHNFNLLRNGEQPNYEPEMFKEYLEKCLMCKVPLQKDFVDIAKKFVK